MRKLISMFLLVLFGIALVGCGEDISTLLTTGTTTEATTEELTTVPTSGLVTDPTSEVTTEYSGEDGVPYFTGLFTKQTYYIGSQQGNLLAGAKAIDPEDGELPIQLVGGYSWTRPGTYSGIYAIAEDSDGNIISEEIVLTVKNLTSYTIPTTRTEDPIVIDLWHSNGTTIENSLKKYALEFHALYPNITVNIIKAGATYDELRDNTINAIKGGQLPNIVQNYPDHGMEYIDNSALISLTPYIYNQTWGYNSAVENESFTDILVNYRRENSQYTADGEYYSVPFNKSTEVMIYNKTMFDVLIEDGVIDEIPTTWQGLFAIADDLIAIKDDVIDDITAKLNASTTDTLHKTAEEIQTIKDNFMPFVYDSSDNAFITLTRQWGGLYTGINAQRQGLILFDNDETRAMLSYFFDNRDTTFTLPDLWLPGGYGSDFFKIGQVAVTFGSTGGARYNAPAIVNGESVFEFGVMPMPYNEDMPESRTAIQQGPNMSITTAGTDQEKLASWLFLKYLTSAEVQLDFALETGYSPVRYTVYNTPTFVQFAAGLDLDGTPLVGEMLMKSMAANAAAQQAEYLFFDQAFVGSSAARDAVAVLFERVILGSLEETTKQEIIENAIAYAKSEAEKVLT